MFSSVPSLGIEERGTDSEKIWAELNGITTRPMDTLKAARRSGKHVPLATNTTFRPSVSRQTPIHTKEGYRLLLLIRAVDCLVVFSFIRLPACRENAVAGCLIWRTGNWRWSSLAQGLLWKHLICGRLLSAPAKTVPPPSFVRFRAP